MVRLDYKDSNFNSELAKLYDRPGFPPEIEEGVRAIINAVRSEGDVALSRFAKQFDHADLAPSEFLVTPEEVAAAAKKLSAADKKAIRSALANVVDFARQRIPKAWSYTPRPGVRLGERFVPMQRVGVYVPGGTAPLVSTVIHTAGIAKAAGVREIVAATPPGSDGSVHPAVLYAMSCAGVTEIYRLGGVYGVAAMAFGTETIGKVEKIVGPGNAYVTAAKKLVYGEVAIDMIAGPSEILIIADDTAEVEFAAADILSQAEHGSGLEQCVLVSDSDAFLDAVTAEVNRRKKALPRIDTVEKVLSKGTFLIKTPNLDVAAEIASEYAPEHLEIMTAKPQQLAGKIKAAGAIFMGSWTPEPVGDFCAGPSHVLPTGGSARFFSGLTVEGFFRRMSTVSYTRKAIEREAGTIERIAAMEGLSAHGSSGTVRVKDHK